MVQNNKVLMTQEGYDKLVQELEYTKNVLQKKNIEDIKDARSQGDLSENADYDAARDQQAKIAARIKELELQIKNAEIIQESKTFTIKFLENVEADEQEVEVYEIVGSLEADPLSGKISNDSPLGKALYNAKKGDEVFVTPEGQKSFKVKVLDIETKIK